jgi:hypothetical protein
MDNQDGQAIEELFVRLSEVERQAPPRDSEVIQAGTLVGGGNGNRRDAGQIGFAAMRTRTMRAHYLPVDTRGSKASGVGAPLSIKHFASKRNRRGCPLGLSGSFLILM